MTPVFKYRKCPKCYGWGKVKGKRKPTITCPKCRGRCEVLVLYNGKKVKEGTEVNQQFTALVNDVATAAKMDDAKDGKKPTLRRASAGDAPSTTGDDRPTLHPRNN